MNPPTIGHAEVFKAMAGVGGDYKIFVTQSQDKKENPLSYSEKVKFIKAIHPEYAQNVVEDTNLNTIGKVCSYLYDQGYRNVTFVAGSDRLPQFQKLIGDYNGVEGKAHGFYKFETLDFKSSGQRDPDSPGVSGVSASKAREAAATGNFEKFEEATGAGQYAKPMFIAVRQGMGIKDEVEEDISRRGFLRGIGAAAAGAAGIGAANKAQAQVSGEDTLPDIVAHVKFKVNEKEITKDINLGTTYKSPREAAEALEKFMKSKGIKYFDYTLERVKPKDNDYMDAKPMFIPVRQGMGIKDAVGEALHQRLKDRVDYITEAPLDFDKDSPTDSEIYGHKGVNPASIKTRIARARGQLKELAAKADSDELIMWESIANHFPELAMNIEQIKHAIEELTAIKSKGGIRSRNIKI
jgi:hypothetical protein